jgi:hypothetical protein
MTIGSPLHNVARSCSSCSRSSSSVIGVWGGELRVRVGLGSLPAVLSFTAGEVLRFALRSVAPVEARRVRRVNHPVVVLAGARQPPDLVEEVDAELAVVDRQAV